MNNRGFLQPLIWMLQVAQYSLSPLALAVSLVRFFLQYAQMKHSGWRFFPKTVKELP